MLLSSCTDVKRDQKQNEPLLDIAGLAARLAVSERFVRRLVHERRIPYLKVGHFVRFDPTDVERMLVASRVEEYERSR
jgi:excisionase family DNA binding protein